MPMQELAKETGKIEDIVCKDIDYSDSFLQICENFSSIPGTVALLSGEGHDCSRYHLLATYPWLSFTAKSNRICLQTAGNTYRFTANIFDTLRDISGLYHFDTPVFPSPVCSGLFGYLSYDLKDQIEQLPKTSVDDLYLPDICLYAPSLLLVQDNQEQQRKLYIPVFNKKQAGADADRYFQLFQQIRESDQSRPQNTKQNNYKGQFCSNFQRSEYLQTVERIKEYIKSGHIYQINLSQRFHLDFGGDPFLLFTDLYSQNPAAFYAYINAGDHQILSTSPERFLHRNGNTVETRPIKGTSPRGSTKEQDQEHAEELQASTKDDAELSMIVDLLRNDLGKCCKPGTVTVQEHKRLERYHNVFHLISIVRGTLDTGTDNPELLKATFPGGSITGCPKIRAMEIIDELEPSRRHVYTGSIGYISFQGNMDLSIAIRTATVYADKIFFSVGGGVVYDSDPEKEYQETLHKGHTLMHFFKGGEANKQDTRKKVWFNGKIVPEEEAYISPLSAGFQYGFGFFETLRAEKGNILYLPEHIERLRHSWQQYIAKEFPDLSWDLIIKNLLRENRLQDSTAAVKIIAAQGRQAKPPDDNLLLVSANHYIPRLEQKNRRALTLKTYPEPRFTPLADHKSLNYLFYYLSGNWAKEKGADEALILNPDGSISETNTGNILILSGKQVVIPASEHVLPGIMLNRAVKLLQARGYQVRTQTVYPRRITSADLVIMTNSLMGTVNISSLDDISLPFNPEFCFTLNRELL